MAKAPILKNGKNKDTPAKKDKAINFYKNITIEDLTYLLKLLKKKEIMASDINHWIKSVDMIVKNNDPRIDVAHIRAWKYNKDKELQKGMNLEDALQNANEKIRNEIKVTAEIVPKPMVFQNDLWSRNH